VGITGVTDPNNNAIITITGVTQDEPTNGQGDGDTAIDAIINGDGTVLRVPSARETVTDASIAFPLPPRTSRAVPRLRSS
jgi:hypothetical protein